MKQRTILFCVSLVVIVLGLSASEKGPVAVSPGSDFGIALIGDKCPTFSWAAVEWAKKYRIEVFEAINNEALLYEDMEAKAYPILTKEIEGRALSWTPSSDEQLSNGSMYVWYVQAKDAYGTAKWSKGRSFRVEVDNRYGVIIDKVAEILRENGIRDEIIGDVLKDISIEAEKISASGGYNITDKIGIQGYEGGNGTFYGINAGLYITTGDLNSFFGNNAGMKTTTGSYNVFVGAGSGWENLTGYHNTFVGMDNGQQNTTGYENTFLGFQAGLYNTEGYQNTFLGAYAGEYNTNGDLNTFIGYKAGLRNTTGAENTFIGTEAGGGNTSGFSNTFMGRSAGSHNETGYKNTFIGRHAGHNNTSGYMNTFIGEDAGRGNTMGASNTFVGNSAGYLNTEGIENTFIGLVAGRDNTEGDFNTFIGGYAGFENTTGNENTFIGYQSGRDNTTGLENTFIGREAGANNETGNNNTFIGNLAGLSNTAGLENTFIGAKTGSGNTGNNNTFIGKSAGSNNITGAGNIFLGHKAGYNETGSNKLYIDNSNTISPLIYGEFDNDIVAINGKLGVGTQSPGYDLEVETSGKNSVFALDRTDGTKTVLTSRSNMAALGTLTNHPLVFAVNSAWKMRLNTDNSLSMSNGATCTAGGVWQDASSRAYKENIQDLSIKDAESTLFALNPVIYNYKKDKEDEHLGFIAEDVPELVASKDRKGMSPMDVVAVLTKVTQEQQKAISKLEKRIAELEKR